MKFIHRLKTDRVVFSIGSHPEFLTVVEGKSKFTDLDFGEQRQSVINGVVRLQKSGEPLPYFGYDCPGTRVSPDGVGTETRVRSLYLLPEHLPRSTLVTLSGT